MQVTISFDMRDPVDRADVIKLKLRDIGLTPTKIAEELKVSKAFIGDVIHSRRASKNVRQFIADSIEQPVDMLWPAKLGRDIMT